MQMEEKQILQRVLERYINTGSIADDQVMVTCLPVDKTCCVDKIGEDGRIMMLDEYSVGGKIIRATYSLRSKTVYFSLKS